MRIEIVKKTLWGKPRWKTIREWNSIQSSSIRRARRIVKVPIRKKRASAENRSEGEEKPRFESRSQIKIAKVEGGHSGQNAKKN